MLYVIGCHTKYSFVLHLFIYHRSIILTVFNTCIFKQFIELNSQIKNLGVKYRSCIFKLEQNRFQIRYLYTYFSEVIISIRTNVVRIEIFFILKTLKFP